MMKIIQAENLGLKFKYHREKRGTLKGTLARLISSQKRLPTEFWALRGLSFSVNKGETLGVIGRNGAGKSTLLRLIGGIYAPNEGLLEVTGSVSTLLSVTAGFQKELTGVENIYLTGVLMGFNEKEIDAVVEEVIEFSELGEFIEAPVKTYSSGMYARLGFSIAIKLKKDIMLIDEVLGVGDSKFREKCEKKIEETIKDDVTIVLVSHSMTAIEKFCDKVIWLEKPAIKEMGAPQYVVERYLGS
jgi:ABC-type polysaccharide/polyol phosphate transport system ATPase subunit